MNVGRKISVFVSKGLKSKKIQIKYKSAKEKSSINSTSLIEMKALLGILIQAGANHDGHLSVEEMFSPQYGASLYRSTMSAFRFNFLLRCIRFDDINTRAEREKNDKFFKFRQVFESFVTNCQKHYIPGDKLTIDEQLLGFRGQCPWRMYIPSKPAKYGIKIIMICDAESYYVHV